MSMQSSMRAYVGGEGLWSKGQKEAVFSLKAYAASKSEADYQAYLQAIAVPLGDHKARIALEQMEPDIETARQGFIEGKNHPDDVPGMIRLYLLFRHTPLLEKPIAIWAEGDEHINRLTSLGQQLRSRIQNGNIDEAELLTFFEEVDAVNQELAPLEDAFSRVLGDVSRQANLLINALVTLITLVMLGAGVALSRRMVKQRVQFSESLQQSEASLRAMIDTAMDAVVVINSESIVTHWSSQAEVMLGWSKGDAIGKPFQGLILPPDQRELHLQGMRRFQLTGAGPFMNKRIEVQAMRQDGSRFPVELSISSIQSQGSLSFCAFIRDITSQKQAAEQLKNLAHYDLITGLPNRVLFQDRLNQETKQFNRNGLPLAVMFLDIDHFKDINDTLGHDKGDILLRQVAERLNRCLREADTLARFGGDEFVVILSQLHDLGAVDQAAERMLNAISAPFYLDEEVAYVSISIGISIYPMDADSCEDLIKNADQAMYLVKKSGRNSYTYFTSSMQQAALVRRQLANDMRSALENQQYLVYYQPIVSLDTGEIHKAEALIHWQHPVYGLMLPDDFIPIAEEIGMIDDIGEWVFGTVARQLSHWRAVYNDRFQISVNKSPAQFQKNGKHFMAWCDQLHKLGLPGEAVIVEITEGMLLEASEHIKETLLEFRDAGIQIALDDFGTGYSSFLYLNKFDIDFIKIDQTFVKNLAAGSDQMNLCEAIIAMAHKLRLKVIAEGVETEFEKRLLMGMGCDYAQGYLFSKPLPSEEFEAWFKSRKK